MLNKSTLWQIWLAIERTQTQVLLETSDSELVRRLQKQLEAQIFISDSELNAARNYIQSSVSLIRDIAEGRLVGA
jgi:hypothetical protein